MLTTSMLILEPFVSFSVDFYEKYTGRFFHNSDEFLALVAVIINVTRLLLQIALSGWITMQFGFTIFLGFTLA